MDFQYYLNAYGFLILGLLLIVFNLPVLLVVCANKKLRNQYGVLIISLFNGFLSGAVSASYGIFRIVLFSTNRDDMQVTILDCFYNPLNVLLLWTFPMTALGLLLNSIDRLLVICFPLSYFKFNTKVVILMNIIALVINATIVFLSIYRTLTTRPNHLLVHILCHQNELYSKEVYIWIAAIRTVFALLAVILMLVVLVIFVKTNRIRSKQAFQSDQTIKRFNARQMNYTKTMLISCIATVVVFIAPSIVAIIARATTPGTSGHFTTWTRFVSFFNSFNIAILLIYRQHDIRWRLYKAVNYLCRRKLLSVSTIESSYGEHSRAHGGQHTHTRTSSRKMS